MRHISRNALRVVALLALAAALVGVPAFVAVTVGRPFPSIGQLQSVWRTRQVDADFVVRLGTAVFVLLWAWFAVTAVVEFVRVLTRPSSVHREGDIAAPSPTNWVKGLVRFIAISSVAATVISAGSTLGHRSPVALEGPPASSVVVQPTSSPTVPAAPSVVSVASEAPVAPTVAPPTTGIVPHLSTVIDRNTGDRTGLELAVLLAAGALGSVEARRRRRLRSGGIESRLAPPTFEQARAEMLLRSSDPAGRIVRLDIALRSAAGDIAALGGHILAAVLVDSGEIHLHVAGCSGPTSGRWVVDATDGTWKLGSSVPLSELVASSSNTIQPCPAMVHLGRLVDGGELFVDLEALGVLAVASPLAAQILGTMAATLAVSPFLENGRVVAVGVDTGGMETGGDHTVDVVTTVEEALDRAIADSRAIAEAATDTGSSTFALRCGGTSGEPWEPTIVIAADVAASASARLSNLAAGRGLAVVASGELADVPHRIRFDGVHHVLEPLGISFAPVGLGASDLAAVVDLVQQASAPLETCAPVVPIERRSSSVSFQEPSWRILVRLFGPVEVVSEDGVSISFERSKALELVVWLTQHRERPTRTKARTALWELSVRDATFANVVSEARRAMARTVPPDHGTEWIGRTLTEDLPLHREVITDAELLTLRVAAAKGLSPVDAIELVRPGLELVVGLPFENTNFAWTDAEGHTSALVLLATGAAIQLANQYLVLGDIDGVFWATGQGLRVLSGHEELIALRMRAHAMRGDRAGVRHEWESYERALASDPWADAQPAPKLVALLRELLAAEPRATAAPRATG